MNQNESDSKDSIGKKKKKHKHKREYFFDGEIIKIEKIINEYEEQDEQKDKKVGFK